MNTTRDTRQRGQLEYRRARNDLGASRVQYQAAGLWNNLSHAEQSVCGIKQFGNKLRDKAIDEYPNE